MVDRAATGATHAVVSAGAGSAWVARATVAFLFALKPARVTVNGGPETVDIPAGDALRLDSVLPGPKDLAVAVEAGEVYAAGLWPLADAAS
jgi:hypothetical protein